METSLRRTANSNSLFFEKKHYRLIFLFFLIALAAVAILNLEINKYLYIAVFLIAGLFFDFDTLSAFLIMSIPFHSIVPFKEFTLIFVILDFIRHKRIRLHNYNIVIIAVLSLIEIVGEMRCGGSLTNAISFVFVLFAVSLIVENYRRDYGRHENGIVNSFVLGSFASIVSTLIIALNNSWFTTPTYRFGEANGTIYDFAIGANGIGLLSLLCLSILLFKIIHKKGLLSLNILLMVAFLIFGLFTQSRAFLIGIIGFAVFLLVFLFLGNKHLLKPLVLLLILVAVAFLLFNRFFTVYINALFERFTEYDDISNGRLALNSFYLSHLFDSTFGSLFGYGLFSYPTYFNASNSGHNALIEMLVAWGLVGFLVSIIWIISLFLLAKPKKIDLLSLIPFLLLVLMSQSTRLFRNLTSIFYFGVCLLSFFPKKYNRFSK